MTLEQTFEHEALMAAAKRQAAQYEQCATDLAINLRIVERRLAETQRMAHIALAYCVSGQFEAARKVLESL